MELGKILRIVMIALLVSAASLASADEPYWWLSTTSRAETGGGTAVVFNLPDGSGAAFSEAVSEHFQPIDATLTLTLINPSGIPVVDYPREDLWLINDDGGEFGGLAPCGGYATADANTDVNGEARWANPLAAGGYSQGLSVVYIAGAPLETSAGEDISFNSADINGDLLVDLLDVVQFTQDFYSGSYKFRSDFLYDGGVDLLDVVELSVAQAVSCPAR